MNTEKFNIFFNKHKWLIIGIGAGLLLGIFILSFGFFKVLFVLLIMAIIGGIGYLWDKGIKIGDFLKSLFGKRRG